MTGFHGVACDDTRDSYDIMSHKHDGPFFTGTLLKLHTQRPESDDFNVLQAQINSKNVTTLRGDRLIDHQGYVQVSHGVAIGMSYGPIGITNEKTNEMQWRSHANLRSNVNGPSDAQTHGPALPHHLVTYFNHQQVFAVSAEGGLTAQGGVSAGNGSFVVSPLGTYRTLQTLPSAPMPPCHMAPCQHNHQPSYTCSKHIANLSEPCRNLA